MSSETSESELSVAEERDTISKSFNGGTPNLSRIMNICSISKIEQPSMLTNESNSSPKPLSQMSFHNGLKPLKILPKNRSGIF